MTTSPTPFLVEFAAGDDVPIPAGKLAYFETRVRNTFFDYVVSKFREREKAGLTKAKLARRIGRSPAVITRDLATPNNWTLDTVTVLLLGICAEEFQPKSSSVLGRVAQNFDASWAWGTEIEQEKPDPSKDYLSQGKRSPDQADRPAQLGGQ